jgi:NADPH:quinone reductase
MTARKGKSMKAVWFEKYGRAFDVLQYGEMPQPTPGPGEVRVEVHASGVNRADTKERQPETAQPMLFPRVIPHQDGAGVIDAVGVGVSRARIGERVWLFEAQRGRPFGTAAEYVVLPERNAISLPCGTTFGEGACLGIPAMTAHRCLFQDGAIRGQTILITGAAGGVGYYAIQFAKLAGARVIALARKKDAALVSEAGADHVIERGDNVVDRVKSIVGGSSGVDRIVEVAFGANLATNIEVLSANGTVSTYASDAEHEPRLPFYPLSNKSPTLHFVFVFAMPWDAHERAASDIGRWLEEGKLKHRIGLRVPLEQTAHAQEETERGTEGRAIIDVATGSARFRLGQSVA